MNPCFPEIKKNFGFGMMRLPMNGEEVDIAQTTKMVDAFLAAGFNYFDTAHVYIGGKSETTIKACIVDRYPRDSFLLANKLSGSCIQKEADLVPFFENQRKACGVDYFDFYLVHAVSEKQNLIFENANAYPFLKTLKAEGKIRHLGFSFHGTPAFLEKYLTDHPEMEFVQLQFNYADYEDPQVESRKCYEICRQFQKPVLVMEPVKGGSLVNLPGEALSLLTHSPASYAIRYAAGFEGIIMVLSGMSDMAQVEDNIAHMRSFKPLTEEEQEIIGKVHTLYQAQNRIPCTGCRYCTPGCPAGIPIPEVFSLMNEKRTGEGQPEDAYAALPVRADACLDCGKCEKECPQHLQIRKLLSEVSKAFA